MPILKTERLELRELCFADDAFILELLNEPGFLRHIGDKGVRSLPDARQYIAKGPMASYRRCGFGLYLVSLAGGGEPVGICGLLKRDTLPDVDVGFAFLSRYWSRGYAVESAAAMLDHGRRQSGAQAHGGDHRARESRLHRGARENRAEVRAHGEVGRRPP